MHTQFVSAGACSPASGPPDSLPWAQAAACGGNGGQSPSSTTTTTTTTTTLVPTEKASGNLLTRPGDGHPSAECTGARPGLNGVN